MLVALIAAGLFRPLPAAETMTQLKSYLESALAERTKLQRENPAVEYADSDNPARNFLKTTNQKNGRYPFGCTLVNRDFYCPFCKRSTADKPGAAEAAAAKTKTSGAKSTGTKTSGRGTTRKPAEEPAETLDADGLLVHDASCTKGRAVELQWRELVEKIALTEEYNEKIAEKTAEINDIKERIEDLKLGRTTTREPLRIKTKSNEPFWLESIFRAPFGKAAQNTPLAETGRKNFYTFTPRQPFRVYDRYTVGLIPSTKQIWSVRAEISPARALGVDLRKELDRARAVMEFKYEIPARRISSTDWVFEFAEPAPKGAKTDADGNDSSTNIVRKIVLSPGCITAFDVKLRELAWKEDPSQRPDIPAPAYADDDDGLTERQQLEKDAEAL